MKMTPPSNSWGNWWYTHPHPREQTHIYENITFQQLPWRKVNILDNFNSCNSHTKMFTSIKISDLINTRRDICLFPSSFLCLMHRGVKYLQWRIQVFLQVGAWNLEEGGGWTHNFAKLHAIERIWTPREGVRPKFYYVDPPMTSQRTHLHIIIVIIFHQITKQRISWVFMKEYTGFISWRDLNCLFPEGPLALKETNSWDPWRK